MNESLITVENAQKKYRGAAVLTVDAFHLKAGERIQVVGTNGSGKSTFLRMLAGVTRPSSGRVHRHIGDPPVTVGFVPQVGGTFDELSLRHNARLISSAIGSRQSLADDERLLEKFDLRPVLDGAVGNLSDGMRRLATFLCVWAANPTVLIADEPFAGIDPDKAADVEKLVDEQIANSSRSYIFSTHSLAGSGRAVFVREGKLDVA